MNKEKSQETDKSEQEREIKFRKSNKHFKRLSN